MVGIGGLSSFLNQGSSFGGGSNDIYSLMNNYASIRNGSYAKVLNATYGKGPMASRPEAAAPVKPTETPVAVKELTGIKNDAAALKKAASELTKNGSDMAYGSMKNFVDAYNKVLDSAGDSSSSSVLRPTVSMVGNTEQNRDLLAKVGISINKDNTLSIDKGAFEKADKNALKSLFGGNSSYGSSVAGRASMIQYNAAYQATKASSYNGFGGYSSSSTSGLLFNDFA